jgi:hypothetical protein
MRRRRAALLLSLSACGDGGAAPTCEVKTSLIDHTRWAQVPPETDPFRIDGTRCADHQMRVEDFSGERSFTIETRGCRWATVEQPALAAVRAGETLTFRLWFFSQTSFEVAEASLVVALGATPLWTERVPLPSLSGGLLFGSFAAPRDIGAGEAILWHVGNHGTNSWNLIEVSRTGLEPCPRDGGT